MSDDAPSKFATALTWAAVLISAVLIVLGIYWYGLSLEVQQRFWSNIFERAGGPMTFRFVLQPAMAFLAALHDGINDARHGHKAFFWSVHGDPTVKAGRLREGLTSVARVILLGISMDVIYQFKELDQFYPAEAVMMALLLAVIPYFIFRWIVEQVAHWWLARSAGSAR
jgi:hypothetical protein